MIVEYISVGTEILLGNIINTNAAFLAEQFAKLGLTAYYQTSVGDNKARINECLDIAIQRSDIIVISGGMGPSSEDVTKESVAMFLGKETIDMYNTGESRGQSQSYNMNYQKLGHDLMSIDELAVMDGSKCIVQVRGVRPFLSDKYDLTQHPNYKDTADADKKNWFDIEKFLSHKLILKKDDVYDVVEMED